ncbi:MAG: phasin family protein [Chakrabartia sp.]
MMAKKTAEKAKKAKTTTAEKIAEPIKKATKTIRETASKAVENTVAINTKVIDHAETNAHEAFAAMRKVAGAKTVQDVVKVQSAFVKAQSARSTAQVREVGEMIASFGRDALAMMRGK